MNKGTDEGFFLINGQKSPMHCLVQTTDEPGYLSHTHYHNYIEILYGLDCDTTVWIEETQYSLKNGDICVINKKETHSIFSERAYNRYFVIKFSPELLLYEGQTSFELSYILPFFSNNKRIESVIDKEMLNGEEIGEIIARIQTEWYEKKPGYEIYLRGQILQLFCHIVRVWAKQNKEIFKPLADGETVKIIKEAAEYAASNLDTVTEIEVSKHFNVSYSYFSRTFKKIMGRSFTKYLNELRLDAAKRRLLTSDMNITEIAADVGFSSSSHFIASFKSYTGITPLQYKKKYATDL